MKKLIFVLLALCLTATACINKEPDVEEKYPKDISFTEYILDATSCQWKNFEYNSSKPDNGKVLIINSNEELKIILSVQTAAIPKLIFQKILYC